MPTLTVKKDTWAKATTDPSSELPGDQKALLTAGAYNILAYGEASTDDRYSNQDHAAVHMVVTFDPDDLPVAVHNEEGTRLNTVVLYHGHAEVEGNIPGNKPKDSEPANPPRDRGIRVILPGFAGDYYSGDPVQGTNRYGKRGNFTWGEMLHANAATGRYRKPHSSQVVKNIISVCDALEEIKAMYDGAPVLINSGYRDPDTNRQVGGASGSRHLVGDAADFRILNGKGGIINPYDVYKRLDGWWGNRGGLASSSVFTHIDRRGYKARWGYGF
jgi:hypothetical protein